MSVWLVHSEGTGSPGPTHSGYSGGWDMSPAGGWATLSADVFAAGKLCADVPQAKNTKPSAPLAMPDGTVVLGVSCMQYGDDPGGPMDRQWNIAGRIAASTDGGVSWDFGTIDFTGPTAAPLFIQFGRDFSGVPADVGGGSHVYAYFNVGTAPDGKSQRSYWNNGDGLLLGRASATAVAVANRSAWEFYVSGGTTATAAATADDSDSESGSGNAPVWSQDANKAAHVFRHANMTGENVVSYHPGLRRYLMANYGFYRGDTGAPWSWFNPPVQGRRWSQLALLEAPQPWGPWSTVAVVDNWRDDEAAYTPTLPTQWFAPLKARVAATRTTAPGTGIDNENDNGGAVLQADMWLVHSGYWGDYNFATVPLSVDVHLS